MTLIRKAKKKKSIIYMVAGAVVVVAMVALIIWIFTDYDREITQTNTGKGSQHEDEVPDDKSEDSNESLNHGDTPERNMRKYFVDYVVESECQYPDGIYDIRIRFPNGEDFVVVAGKNVISADEGGFFVMLGDEEVYSLSSAKADSEIYAGAELYLAGYISDNHTVSRVDYPVNLYVSMLYHDELVIQDNYDRRVQLEENLATFMNQAFVK